MERITERPRGARLPGTSAVSISAISDSPSPSCPDGGGRDRWNARNAGKHEAAGRARRLIERCDAGGERGVVGEVEIVDLVRDAKPGQPAGIAAIGLERPGGVHHERGRGVRDGREVLADIDAERGAAILRGEGGRLARVAARDDNLDAVLQQEPREPPAEHAIAAEDQDFHGENLMPEGGRDAAGWWNERAHSPHPVLLPMGEGTPERAGAFLASFSQVMGRGTG